MCSSATVVIAFKAHLPLSGKTHNPTGAGIIKSCIVKFVSAKTQQK